MASDFLPEPTPDLPIVTGLDDRSLLDAWEASAGLARPWRELALLDAATGEGFERLARLPIGRRDALLLELHRTEFGQELEAEAVCPSCSERVEMTIGIDRVLAAEAGPIEPAAPAVDGSIELRAPDSIDLAAALDARDSGGDPVAVLLERIAQPGSPPSSTPEALDRQLAALDPLADLTVELACPSCRTRWSEVLDPASFVLGRLEHRAQQLLDEVDVLARAYGWGEADVLAMSAFRRARYLEMALA